jgi:hypothetical protein
VNQGWHRDRKENPISAPSIHVGALVDAGSLWPKLKGNEITTWTPRQLSFRKTNIRNRVFHKVRKTQHQNPEFGPKPGEIPNKVHSHSTGVKLRSASFFVVN